MNNLKKLLEKFGGKKDIHISLGVSPQSDWKIILVSTLALSVLVIIFSAYMFIEIDKGDIFQIEKGEGNEELTIDEELLQSIVSYYSAKATEFERIRGARIPSVDPSL